MQIICPQCQANYELDADISITGLICQRCGHEFFDPTTKLNTGDSVAINALFPQRQAVRLLPWFFIMLSLISGIVLWLQYDKWIEQRWFRSSLMNIGISLQQRDQDWYIPPNSVHPHWITRTDGSKVLLIQGQVSNLLSSDMMPPNIEIIFFSKAIPDQRIGSLLLDFTYAPSELVMLQTPYQTPNINYHPIAALGSRKFTYLLIDTPTDMGDFSLNPRSQ